MKTDSSRHVTLIPDKPACVNPSFTAANCRHSQYTTAAADLLYLLSPESFKFKCCFCFSFLEWFTVFFSEDGQPSRKSNTVHFTFTLALISAGRGSAERSGDRISISCYSTGKKSPAVSIINSSFLHCEIHKLLSSRRFLPL